MGNNDLEKERISGIFTRASKTFGEDEPRIFSYFGEKLANFTKIKIDSNILDIAAGRGSIAIPLSEKLGETGKITCIDISEGMINELTSDIEDRKISNIQAIKMDAESMDFPDSTFDFVFCGFGLFFFATLGKAFSVLKDNGKLIVSSWLNDPSRPLKWYSDIIDKYVPEDKEKNEDQEENTEEKYDFFTEEGLKAIFSKFGFKNIKISTEEKEFVYKTEEIWWKKSWSHGGRASLEKISKEKMNDFKKEVYDDLSSRMDKDGFHHVLKVINASGDK
jgi:demethylmenaquinone methyltransferase/2-methoxy-6-polyprenyl-1,4-benzoquinol methylase